MDWRYSPRIQRVGENQLTNQHKFLHELLKEQERNELIQRIIEDDPWRYSEPPPWPLTLENNDA
jgi:hypothetical protein